MNAPSMIGHNQPPDPIDEIKAKFADTILEVENWLDGSPVENEGQMKAVDALLAAVKEAEGAAKAAKEEEYRPHKAACDAVVSRWKPVLDDFDRMKKGLAAAVTAFKNKLAAEKEAEKRRAYEEAEAKRRAAEEAQRTADMADLEARRRADELAAEAREAERQAQAARDDKVKGLRTYTIPEIVDGTACARWIWLNDREALMTFMQEYVARKTREGVRGIAGVEVRTEKRAI